MRKLISYTDKESLFVHTPQDFFKSLATSSSQLIIGCPDLNRKELLEKSYIEKSGLVPFVRTSWTTLTIHYIWNYKYVVKVKSQQSPVLRP